MLLLNVTVGIEFTTMLFVALPVHAPFTTVYVIVCGLPDVPAAFASKLFPVTPLPLNVPPDGLT